MALHVSVCDAPSCRISVDGKLPQCPQCGGPVRYIRQAQPRGWVLLILGAFLLLMMAAVAYYTVPLMLRPGEESGGTRFDGTTGQALLVIGLFALLIGFGLAAALGGVHEIVTGRQHPVFLSLVYWIFTLLILAAMTVQLLG